MEEASVEFAPPSSPSSSASSATSSSPSGAVSFSLSLLKSKTSDELASDESLCWVPSRLALFFPTTLSTAVRFELCCRALLFSLS